MERPPWRITGWWHCRGARARGGARGGAGGARGGVRGGTWRRVRRRHRIHTHSCHRQASRRQPEVPNNWFTPSHGVSDSISLSQIFQVAFVFRSHECHDSHCAHGIVVNFSTMVPEQWSLNINRLKRSNWSLNNGPWTMMLCINIGCVSEPIPFWLCIFCRQCRETHDCCFDTFNIFSFRPLCFFIRTDLIVLCAGKPYGWCFATGSPK